MGVIGKILELIFGGDRNALRETVEVFRENADSSAARSVQVQGAALAQFGAEFTKDRRGGFDRFMDGLNRVPRPALALGTLGLFLSAMIEPLWFAQRMQGLALVPEPLWWLLGVIVSFYFGARHQLKSQQFQRDMASSIALVPHVLDNIDQLRARHQPQHTSPPQPVPAKAALKPSLPPSHPQANAALDAWKAAQR